MKRCCAVVIPIYCETLNLMEKISVFKNVLTLQQWDIFFIAPLNLNTFWYKTNFPSVGIQRYSERFFQGLSAYNKLMLTASFYAEWKNYEYILICQTDAIVLSDQLERFCNLAFDYLGAPLFRPLDGKPYIYGGNGGFSLRNTVACQQILERHPNEVNAYIHDAEDVFFSSCGIKYPDEFRIAPPQLSMKFAFDQFPRFLFRKIDHSVPFAIHGWFTYDYEFTKTLVTEINIKDTDIPSLKKRSAAERKIYDFCKKHKTVVLYGAGQWGLVFARYLQIKNVQVKQFIVSNDQDIKEHIYSGIPVMHLRDVSNQISDYAVIITLSRRSLGDDNLYGSICKLLRKIGVGDILETDLVMYNAAVETWLMTYEKELLQ